jgi:F-type H+-transporting ATPase subunit a
MSLVPESIEFHVKNIPVTLLMSWLAWAIIGVPSFIVARTARVVPSGMQNFFEMCFEGVFGLADESIGEDAPRYYPLFIGIFAYILVGNILGLIPGLISPTSDFNTTVALALIVFVYYNFQGFRKHGFGYLKHFLGPEMPWFMFPVRGLMFIIEIIGNFARPFSLALRLFCNIFSKEMLLGLLALIITQFFFGKTPIEKALTIAPLLLRPFIILLGLMLGLIQALIFLILSIAYVAGAVHSESENEH